MLAEGSQGKEGGMDSEQYTDAVLKGVLASDDFVEE